MNLDDLKMRIAGWSFRLRDRVGTSETAGEVLAVLRNYQDSLAITIEQLEKIAPEPLEVTAKAAAFEPDESAESAPEQESKGEQPLVHQSGESKIARISGLYRYLTSRIRGQEEVLEVIANAICRAELGMVNDRKPRSSMLYLGPTGVGKTETARQLAEFLYSDADAMHRFDMAEYQDTEAIGRLIGKDADNEGSLSRVVSGMPQGGIILFDEIEKADTNLAKLFLSILDAGYYTSANGNIVRMNDFILIFTSNLGGAEASRMRAVPYSTLQRRMKGQATKYFAPELFARFNEVCVFKTLDFEVQREIAEDVIEKERRKLEKSIQKHAQNPHIRIVAVEDSATRIIIANGFDRERGARPLEQETARSLGNALTAYLQAFPKPAERLIYTVSEDNIVLAPAENF